jgi:hypothetical protein
MSRHPPARTFVDEQVHVQDRMAPAGADQCSLFLEAILLHNIKSAAIELFGQPFLNDSRRIRRYDEVTEMLPRAS